MTSIHMMTVPAREAAARTGLVDSPAFIGQAVPSSIGGFDLTAVAGPLGVDVPADDEGMLSLDGFAVCSVGVV